MGNLKSKNVKVSVIGATSLALTGHPATISVTRALDSAGVDYKATLKAISKLTRHERRALEDKVISPAELKVPKPDGYTDQKHVDLCSTFAASIRSDWQTLWTRGIAVAGIIVILLKTFL